MRYKETRSLFLGKYQYKVVLVSPVASLLRQGIDEAIEEIDALNTDSKKKSTWWASRIKGPEDIDQAKMLFKDLKKMDSYDLRIEQPNINFYSSIEKDVKFFEKKYADSIKYISKPADGAPLEEGTILMPKMNFDFKITMGSTKQEHSAFVSWANSNSKVKLTKSCTRDLERSKSWGGTHFYVTGENTLLMVKMHLGSSISKIQRIVKQAQD